jgi:two-component system OmpR family response regulator
MASNNTILIVDDEREICLLLSAIIRQKNLNPFYVHTISAANETVNTKNPRLLFLDINLPDGNGLDLLRDLIRENPSLKVVISVLMTNLGEALQSRGL